MIGISAGRALAVVAAIQLATSTCALHYAVERGLAVDALGIRRRGRDVPRDSWFLGTGISPPVAMMALQAWATTSAAVHPTRVSTRTLGALGAAMVLGYAVERESRHALAPAGWDLHVTSSTVLGVSMSALMAGLALRAG